jgi:hypothetical protein
MTSSSEVFVVVTDLETRKRGGEKMRTMKLLILLGAGTLCFVLAPATAMAQVPGVIPIQGYLTDAEGAPYDAEVAARFNIYDAPTGGVELHSERITLPVTQGVFTAYIGSTTSLDLDAFRDHVALYLGIQVGADAEASPRLTFGSVPFAVVSDSTGSFGGVDAADFPTTVEEWAVAACPDTVEELSAILDPVYAAPSWDSITGVPAGLADGDDGFTTEEELTALLDDNYAAAGHAHGWDEITDLPAGFADGVDNGFTTEDELTALLNDNYRAGDWVPGWGDIVGIPAALADGDDDTTYTAGDGLTLDGTEFSLDEDYQDGSAHDDRFINSDGDEMEGDLVLQDNFVIRRIQRTVGYGNDGRDSGYLDGRRLVFDKSRDDTSVRVTWSDNRRGIGYIYGYWEIYFNRQPCTDPGPVRFWHHSYTSPHNHNDNHYNSTLIGYCRATSAGPMRAGEYTIEIQIHHQGGSSSDWYVGWNASTQFVIEAEEVY